MKRAKKRWNASSSFSKNCEMKNLGMRRNWRPKRPFETTSVVAKVSCDREVAVRT